MAREKVSRKELLKEPDTVITTTARIIQFVQDNFRWVTACVIGILVVGIVLLAMRSYHDRRERQAQDLQAQAYQLYRSAVEQEDGAASKDLLSKAKDRFEEVIEEFDGTHAANMARIYRGHASFALGRYEDAIKDYEGAYERISLPEMKALALQGLGFSLMSEGELEPAIETFKKLGEMADSGFQGTVQWNIARCYERQGKVQDAVEIYRELKQSSPDHMRRMLAEAKLAELAGE